jgi:hypothetical protein
LARTASELSFQALAKVGCIVRDRFANVPNTILVKGSTNAITLSELQRLIPGSRIFGLFRNDSEFLLAERFLKDFPTTLALDCSSYETLLKSQRKFDAIIELNHFANIPDICMCLENSKSILKQDGVLILSKNSDIDDKELTLRAKGLGFYVANDQNPQVFEFQERRNQSSFET